MKRKYFIFLFMLMAMTLSARQAKRVYITLDVSSSMIGNKYDLANYTTQMIVTLCDDDDEVYIIVYGVEDCLSKKESPLKAIQKPIDQLRFGTPKSIISEFEDIIGFNNVYKPSENKQNWLFIIGDGDWWYNPKLTAKYEVDKEKFRKTVKEGSLNVCYLQTEHKLDKVTDFTKFADSLGIIDIRKSDINPSTIKDGCDHFARKILGFSEATLKVKKTGQKSISIKAELPLKEFYLVYQNEVRPDQLPIIENVTYGNNSLSAKLRGTPTTTPLKKHQNEVDLSGHVFHIKGNETIPANTEIEVCFDKEIDPANVMIYPLVENVEFGTMTLTRNGGKLKQLDSNSFSICRDESKAMVRIELNSESSGNLPEALLGKTKVIVKANNKDYETTFKDGGFECEIDLLDDETQYYAECDCPGYFKRVTPISKIVKGDCPPAMPTEMRVNELPATNLGTITFEALKRENISFTIRDSLTNKALNPDLFDITFEIENDYLYEDPIMNIKEDSIIVLELHPKGEWCECLFPESLNIKIVSTPKKEAFDEYGKNYQQTVFPINLTVVKESSWLSRCLWIILTIIGLLLFLLYLWALQRKRRFKKNAMLKATYYDYYGNKREGESTHLRKEGFGAWFARWFLPGDEHNTLSFDKPSTSLKFVAANSNDMVNIPKEGNINPETMHIAGYYPQKDQEPDAPVKLGNQGKIKVLNSDGTDEGYLTFDSGEATDGTGYRIFIGLLMVVTVAAIAVLLYLIISSFI